MIQANELRPNNLIIGIYENEEDDGLHEIICTFKFYDCYDNYFYVESKNNITDFSGFKPIPLTEEILLKCGFSIVNENSAGKRYSYVIDGVFSQDFNLVLWKTTKNFGKIYRGNLEIKYLHQFQNLYFALTGEELTVNL